MAEPILKRNRVSGFPRPNYVENAQNILPDLVRGNPKSSLFVIPRAGKNPTFALAAYWGRIADRKQDIKTQTRPAKLLLTVMSFEDACRATKFYTQHWHCSLWWIYKNREKVLGEFIGADKQ